jgi:hypothetical protein
MKKINVLQILLNLIFLVIFNAVFFVAGGTEHMYSVWISYGFIHFAYLMLLLTPILIRKGKSSSVFGFSVYSISSFYFLFELITGVVFILISPDSYKTAMLVQLCIAGLYGVILISHLIANEHTADKEENRHYQIAYVKDASVKVKAILESIKDKEIKKKIERVYDAIYSSPVKSNTNLTNIENSILQSINDLEDTISTENKEQIIKLSESLLEKINERNRQLKTHN